MINTTRYENSKVGKLFIWYFPAVMVYYLLLARGINTYLLWGLVLLGLVCAYHSINATSNSRVKNIMTFFIIYVTFSGILYIFNGVPFDCYTIELLIFIFPMTFFYIGMADCRNEIYKYFVYATIFCIVIGLFLILIKPSWYINFIVSNFEHAWHTSEAYYEEGNLVANSRFLSFFNTSYQVSFYSAFALCIIVPDLIKPQGNRIIKNKALQLTFVFVCVVGVLLSQQRASIAFVAVLIVSMLLLEFGKIRSTRRIIMLIIGMLVFFAILVALLGSNAVFRTMIDNVRLRLEEMNFSTAIDSGERSAQREATLASWNNYVLGDGTGTKGGYARMYGLPAITDGNYIKLLVENGILGSLIFLIIIISSIWRALQFRHYLFPELLMIIFVLISMTGANTISLSFHSVLIFWFAIGRIWNKSYISNKVINRDFI